MSAQSYIEADVIGFFPTLLVLLVVVLMAEDFPVPSILVGSVGIETLSIRVYKLMTQVPARPNQAAAVAMALTAMVCALVLLQRKALAGRVDIAVVRTGDQTGVAGTGLLAAVLFDAVGGGNANFAITGTATAPGGTAGALQVTPVAPVTVR